MERGVELDSDTLRALGAVAWAAINLEDTAETLARTILGRDQAGPISQFMAAAIQRSLESPEDQACIEAREWLERAGEMLRLRNAVLHSIPVLYEEGPTQLLHFPASGGPMVRTQMTIEALDEVARQIWEAQGGWAPIAVAIFSRELPAETPQPPTTQ